MKFDQETIIVALIGLAVGYYFSGSIKRALTPLSASARAIPDVKVAFASPQANQIDKILS